MHRQARGQVDLQVVNSKIYSLNIKTHAIKRKFARLIPVWGGEWGLGIKEEGKHKINKERVLHKLPKVDCCSLEVCRLHAT